MTDVAGVAFRRVGLPGLSLHVAEAGPEAGPPTILLLHGFPEFWYGWRHQIGPLSEAGLRLVVPDQRGYGLSDKPDGVAAYHLDKLAGDVIALADAYGFATIRLVGHDWGGLVAWWTASHYPDRIARLAILNAPHPGVVGAYIRSHPGSGCAAPMSAVPAAGPAGAAAHGRSMPGSAARADPDEPAGRLRAVRPRPLRRSLAAARRDDRDAELVSGACPIAAGDAAPGPGADPDPLGQAGHRPPTRPRGGEPGPLRGRADRMVRSGDPLAPP